MTANEGSSSSRSKKGLVDKWVSIVKGEKPNSLKFYVLTLEHSIRRNPEMMSLRWKRVEWSLHKSPSRSSERLRSFPETSLLNSTSNVCMRARTYKLMFKHFSPGKITKATSIMEPGDFSLISTLYAVTNVHNSLSEETIVCFAQQIVEVSASCE